MERHAGGSSIQEIIMILKIDFKIKLHHGRVDVCCPHMAKCRMQASKRRSLKRHAFVSSRRGH